MRRKRGGSERLRNFSEVSDRTVQTAASKVKWGELSTHPEQQKQSSMCSGFAFPSSPAVPAASGGAGAAEEPSVPASVAQSGAPVRSPARSTRVKLSRSATVASASRRPFLNTSSFTLTAGAEEWQPGATIGSFSKDLDCTSPMRREPEGPLLPFEAGSAVAEDHRPDGRCAQEERHPIGTWGSLWV